MAHPDLVPETSRLAELVRNVPDDALGGPTPCPDYTLGDLLDHVGGLAVAFTAAATKEPLEGASQGGSGDASRLGDDWRTRIPAALRTLGEAWRDPAAWEGMTTAGPVEVPGDVAAQIAFDEVVVHAWDVARASGQPYEPDPGALEVVHGFVSQFSGPGQDEARAGLFGPEVPVPADAPLLDRVVGMAGRDPAWSPT
jgi:uncharacterized protein (TIGR03086 family)